MFTIRKATVADCELIHKMAKEVFPATYKEILSPEQLDYMMDWMYAPSNVRKQMEEEGHVYSIAYKENEPCGYVSIQQQEKDVRKSTFCRLILPPCLQAYYTDSIDFSR
ncbi:GNAT family N-acetyltransferase, partial [Bacteroides ovatus]|nr:GNAT family N-acetyltransferase [Bacteroides ovatus]